MTTDPFSTGRARASQGETEVAPVDGLKIWSNAAVEVVGYPQYEHRGFIYIPGGCLGYIHQEYEPITVNTLRFF